MPYYTSESLLRVFSMMKVHGLHWSGKSGGTSEWHTGENHNKNYASVCTTYEFIIRYSFIFLSQGNDTEVHEQIPFKSFHQHEKKVIFYMFREIKQATRNCGSKPWLTRHDLKRRKNVTSGEFGKAESFLSEELSLSPEKTNNTVSISLISVETSAQVIAQSSRFVYNCLKPVGCCQKPWQWRVCFWFVVHHFENEKAGRRTEIYCAWAAVFPLCPDASKSIVTTYISVVCQ